MPRFASSTPGEGPVQAPLYIPVPRHWRVEDLIDEIPPFFREEAAESDVVVFRTHGTDGEALLEQTQNQFLLTRTARPTWLLQLKGAKPQLLDVATGKPPVDQRLEAEYINVFRECELTAYARAPGVFLEGSETFHYAAPNGKHYRSFLRVGNMLRSLDAVDSICFWIAPRVGTASIILLDSSTILSVGLRSAEYAIEAQKREAKDRLTVDALRGYREPEITLGPRLRRHTEHREEEKPRLVFLESVSSTGELVDYIHETCGERLGFEVEALPIFSSATEGQEQADPLCQIGESNALEDPCELCRKGSQRVNLLPSSYTLEVAADIHAAKLTKADAERGKQYVEDYGGRECVSLHRTEPESGRHHMIYIDGGELLSSSQRFKARVRRELDSLDPPAGAMMTPTHEAACKLGRYAEKRLQIPSLELDEHDLPGDVDDVEQLPEPWLRGLREKPRLLLIDDVVITGARLRRYLNSLEPLFEAVEGLQIAYLVGVARPDHHESLKTIPGMLMGRGTFRAVEEIVLPHWGPTYCPWCREQEVLATLTTGGTQLEGAVLKRYELLSDLDRGLRGDEALLSWDDSPIEGLPRSVFGEGQQVEMFLSVAAAVQTLRNEGRLDEEFRPPVAKVLHPRETFDQRFFEYRIQTLILRACRPHDLNSRLAQRDLVKMLSTRLAGDHDPSDRDPCPVSADVFRQRPELLLAVAQEKLPREWILRGGDNEEERRWIEHVLGDGDKGMCEFLKEAIERG